MYQQIGGVPVFYWNPPRYRRFSKVLGFGPRTDNFGDLIGPDVIRRQLTQKVGSASSLRAVEPHRVLFAVGSVMHFASNDDVIWGTGVNGKVSLDRYKFSKLDVRAVRGPLTRRWLWEERRIDVPEVYGDPALLMRDALRKIAPRRPERSLTVIPNLNDIVPFRRHPGFFSPRRPLAEVATRIAQSERLVTSSLHALVVAELIGVPVRLLRTPSEPEFKYSDYFQGTGRNEWSSFGDLASAARSFDAGTDSGTPDLLESWDSGPLERSFPSELWATA